jgi:hypothetical protein
MSSLFVLPKQSPTYGGANYASARLYLFETGTLTPAVTYSDADRTTPHAHPIVADGGGVFPAIWLDPLETYRVQLKTFEDTLVYDVDPYPGVIGADTVNLELTGNLEVDGTIGSDGQITGRADQGSASAFLAVGLNPAYRHYRSAAPTNEKVWDVVAGAAGSISFQTRTDAGDFGETYIQAVRTGTVVDEIELNATQLDVNAAVVEKVVTFANADATPSVAGANVFITTGTTTITDFDDGILGQTIKIVATGSITITNNASIIKLNGAGNYNMTDTDTLTLTMFVDQVWSEVARSVN